MSGEVRALVEALAANELSIPAPVEPGQFSQRAIPNDWRIHDVDAEHLLDNPRRAIADVKVRSAKGFIDAVKQRWPSPPGSGILFIPPDIEAPQVEPSGEDSARMPIIVRGTEEQLAEIRRINLGPVALYADDNDQKLVAILNDDLGLQAGWRDHRVVLDVRKTEEWQHWLKHQGMLDQRAFADVIEEGQLEIQDPLPAQMLRIAETFEATVGVTFKKGASVRDGAQQYVYEETIDSKAAGGSVEVPEGFTIAVAPFIGGPKYVVRARLRTRLTGGKFTIGYTLERPSDVERHAFRDIATQVAETLQLTPVEGVAPPPRIPRA